MNIIFSKNQVNCYTASEGDENQRLDNLLSKLLKGVPKSYIYRIIRSGEVRVNKKRQQINYKVGLGDVIRIPPVTVKSKSEIDNYIPNKSFPILFEDEYFLVIDKPSGVACHGGSGISFGIIEQLRKSYPKYQFLELAHRLDRDTSGILILAKKRQALVKLHQLMRDGLVNKRYLALTKGRWDNKFQTTKAPLNLYNIRNGERRVKVDEQQGLFAQTNFRVISEHQLKNEKNKSFNDSNDKSSLSYTLVEATLKTGRTHQIRVHLQYLLHPILCDDKYGDFELNKQMIKLGLKRMFLHAYMIKFTHPITAEKVTIQCDLPKQLQHFIDMCALVS